MTTGDIIPTIDPKTSGADTIAAWVDIALRYTPTFHNALVRRLLGPAFTALELAYADGLQAIKESFDAELALVAAYLANAEERAANYELRVNELQADDEAVAAVRNLYAARLERVDKKFAQCRTQLAQCQRERTAQAEYAVTLENRIHELGGTLT